MHYWVLHTTDGGATWEQIPIDTVQHQPNCQTKQNPSRREDHFGGLCAIARDPNGQLVYTYAGNREARASEMIFVRTSADGGMTWTDPKRLSPNRTNSDRRVIAVFPAVTSGGAGDFRLVWMDNRAGLKSWNEWIRESHDGGLTWDQPQLLSDANGGAGYKHPQGFDADYGDYQGISVLSDGRTIATWGEGFSYFGPGGTWLNRESA